MFDHEPTNSDAKRAEAIPLIEVMFAVYILFIGPAVPFPLPFCKINRTIPMAFDGCEEYSPTNELKSIRSRPD